MKPALAAALVLSAAARVSAADVSLDAVGGTLYVTSIDGTRAVDHAFDAAKNEVAIETLSQNGLPIRGISHSRVGLVVHTGLGGSAPLTSALFRQVVQGGSTATVLRDPVTGDITRPSSLRTVALDATDFSLIDAGHLVMPDGTPRAWALIRRASGELVLVDYDFAGGPVRRSPLGFIAPIGSNKGSVLAGPDGHVTVVVASAMRITIYDLLITSFAPAGPPRTIIVGESFRPESTRLGIIAILIGLMTKPAPAVSYQVGDELRVDVLDGNTFRTITRQTIPADASGFMEPEGLFEFFYLLPYIEQENLYRGAVGLGASPILTVEH
jgi:hypothetical protein